MLRRAQLRNGVLVIVPPHLIVRLKSHFHTLPCGVDLIVGLNGRIWVSSASPVSQSHVDAPVDAEHTSSAALYSNINDPITPDRREAVARVAAIVRALAAAAVPITDGVVNEAYEASLERDSDMLVDQDGRLNETTQVKEMAVGESGAEEVVQAVLAHA